MTDILKKRITDIGNLVSGNGTDTTLPPVTISGTSGWEMVGRIAVCLPISLATAGLAGLGTAATCAYLIQ